MFLSSWGRLLWDIRVLFVNEVVPLRLTRSGLAWRVRQGRVYGGNRNLRRKCVSLTQFLTRSLELFPREPCHSLHREPFSPSAFQLGEKVPKADEGAFHKDVIRAPSSAIGPASVNRAYLVKRPPHPASPPSPPARNRVGRRALDEGSCKALGGTIRVRSRRECADSGVHCHQFLDRCTYVNLVPRFDTLQSRALLLQRFSAGGEEPALSERSESKGAEGG